MLIAFFLYIKSIHFVDENLCNRCSVLYTVAHNDPGHWLRLKNTKLTRVYRKCIPWDWTFAVSAPEHLVQAWRTMTTLKRLASCSSHITSHKFVYKYYLHFPLALFFISLFYLLFSSTIGAFIFIYTYSSTVISTSPSGSLLRSSAVHLLGAENNLVVTPKGCPK